MTASIRDADPTSAEAWDARVLRLAREAKATQDAYDTADKHYQAAAREAEAYRLKRAAAHERRVAAGWALRQATSMTAILDAAPPEPVCDTCLNPHLECRCER